MGRQKASAMRGRDPVEDGRTKGRKEERGKRKEERVLRDIVGSGEGNVPVLNEIYLSLPEFTFNDEKYVLLYIGCAGPGLVQTKGEYGLYGNRPCPGRTAGATGCF